jgi:hypothetical protein
MQIEMNFRIIWWFSSFIFIYLASGWVDAATPEYAKNLNPPQYDRISGFFHMIALWNCLCSYLFNLVWSVRYIRGGKKTKFGISWSVFIFVVALPMIYFAIITLFMSFVWADPSIMR